MNWEILPCPSEGFYPFFPSQMPPLKYLVPQLWINHLLCWITQGQATWQNAKPDKKKYAENKLARVL